MPLSTRTKRGLLLTGTLLLIACVLLLQHNLALEEGEGIGNEARAQHSRLVEFKTLSAMPSGWRRMFRGGDVEPRSIRSPRKGGGDETGDEVERVNSAEWTRLVTEAILHEMDDGGKFFPVENEASGGFKPETSEAFRARMETWRARVVRLATAARPNFALSPRYLQTIPGTDILFRTAIRVAKNTFLLPYLIPDQTKRTDVSALIDRCAPSCRCTQARGTMLICKLDDAATARLARTPPPPLVESRRTSMYGDRGRVHTNGVLRVDDDIRLSPNGVKFITLTLKVGKSLAVPVETIHHSDWRAVVEDPRENVEERERRRAAESKDGRIVATTSEEVMVGGVDRGARGASMESTGMAVCLQGVLWRESTLGDIPDEAMRQFIGHYARLGATQIHIYTRNGVYANKLTRLPSPCAGETAAHRKWCRAKVFFHDSPLPEYSKPLSQYPSSSRKFQHFAMLDCYARSYASGARWTVVVDLDEFVFPEERTPMYTNLPDALSLRHDAKPRPPNVHYFPSFMFDTIACAPDPHDPNKHPHGYENFLEHFAFAKLDDRTYIGRRKYAVGRLRDSQYFQILSLLTHKAYIGPEKNNTWGPTVAHIHHTRDGWHSNVCSQFVFDPASATEEQGRPAGFTAHRPPHELKLRSVREVYESIFTDDDAVLEV